MKKCYINGIGCVSAQNTEGDFLKKTIDYPDTNRIHVVKPNYKEFIPPAAIRRMSSGVKNSMVASTLALEQANVNALEGIIVGTGMGCIQDSEKFLDKMIEDNGQYLTPTSFIQSTHNTVSGQIAMNLKCNAYNFTYVNTGGSFQSALLDGLMQVKDEGKNNLLVGGVDEIADYTFKLYQAIGHIKQDNESSYNIFESSSKGCVAGEGAAFFILSNEKKESTYAEIVDTQLFNQLKTEELEEYINDFIQRNAMKMEEIDAVILGNNGDVDFDVYYDEVERIFKLNSSLLYYKHLFGEFMTSPSIAVWIAAQVLQSGKAPSILYKNNENDSNSIKTILIYNQYRGRDHSLTLMKNV